MSKLLIIGAAITAGFFFLSKVKTPEKLFQPTGKPVDLNNVELQVKQPDGKTVAVAPQVPKYNYDIPYEQLHPGSKYAPY